MVPHRLAGSDRLMVRAGTPARYPSAAQAAIAGRGTLLFGQ
jgi:hypothetical protein